MGARQLVAVGFRLFAIWLCVGGLQFFVLVSALKQATATWGGSSWIGFVMVGAFAGVALIVWALSGPMARGLMSGLATTPEARFSANGFLVVACALMGLWWLKESIVPFVFIWLKAVAMSSQTVQSAFAWLGTAGKLTAAMYLMQIGIGVFFVCRPHHIASWVLRHSPVITGDAAAPAEPFDLLLRRTRELGLRQTARPDIVARLTGHLASHPDVHRRFSELQELLQYESNPSTRSVAARAIILSGSEAAVQARKMAAHRLAEENVPEVVKDLVALIALADRHPAAGSDEVPALPAEHGNT